MGAIRSVLVGLIAAIAVPLASAPTAPSAFGASAAGRISPAGAVVGQFQRADADCPACVADVAIYDPDNEDDGVWEEEVTALLSFAKHYGWTTRRVDAAALNAGELGSGSSRRYRMLAAPGGWAAIRMKDVSAAGDQSIRDFVSSGGGYVGLCAGAYWAAQTVTFASVATGGGGSFNAPRDYRSYSYDLGLLSGTAIGPFGWTPWSGGDDPNFQRVRVNTANSSMAAAGLPDSTRFLYFGGPVFRPVTPPPGYEVWARAIAPPGTPARGSTGDGEASVVRFSYGTGTVVLFAYHPDVLIHSRRDGVTLHTYFNERRIRWHTGRLTFAQINSDSWNIVHAAFQSAMAQPVTPAGRG